MDISLPPEVIGEVANHLGDQPETGGRQALFNLALASKMCRVESQRVLFRSLNLDRDYHGGPMIQATRETHRLFLEAILSDPLRLGLHVQVYSSMFLTYAPRKGSIHTPDAIRNCEPRFEDPNTRQGMELWNLTCKVLPLMTKLRHLEFGEGKEDMNGLIKDNAASVVQGLTLPALEHLRWGNSNSFKDLVSVFFPRHPQLRSLSVVGKRRCPLGGCPWIPLIPAHILPNLSMVHAPGNVFLALLGRNITAATWIRQDHRPLCTHLVLSDRAKGALQHMRFLSFAGPAFYIPEILPHLTSLEDLAMVLDNNDLGGKILEHLPEEVKLRKLFISLSSVRDIDKWEEVYIPQLKPLFHVCLTLDTMFLARPLFKVLFDCIMRADGLEAEVGETQHFCAILQHLDPWMPRVRPYNSQIMRHYFL